MKKSRTTNVSDTFHIDQARWAKMTIFEQMGNIYSEVGRTFNSMRRKNNVDRDFASARAIDLFDATVTALVQQKSAKTKEVLRAKDQFLNAVYGDNVTEDELQSLDGYFLQFAIAARLNRYGSK